MTRENTVNVPEHGKVYVEVSGLTGTGKSAVLGEIEITLRALGLAVEHDAAFQAEKNATHADWQVALDLYKPTVVLSEKNIGRAAPLHEGEGAIRWIVDARFTTKPGSKSGGGCSVMVDSQVKADAEEARLRALEFVEAVTVMPLYVAPPPSVEVFDSSSLKGEDTHRATEWSVVTLERLDALHGDLAMFGANMRRDASDERSDDLIPYAVSIKHFAGVLSEIIMDMVSEEEEAVVSPASQVGTSAADEPKPSVEVERLRERLIEIIGGEVCVMPDHGDSIDPSSIEDAADAILAALSRKQEPGVPTPGDWIEWSGGENPVPGQNAEVKLRSGDCFTGSDLSPDATWQHIWGEADIIAYRIVPTPGGEGK